MISGGVYYCCYSYMKFSYVTVFIMLKIIIICNHVDTKYFIHCILYTLHNIMYSYMIIAIIITIINKI